MSNSLIKIFSLFVIIFQCQSAFTQDSNQDKYWSLRSKFLDKYIVIGEVDQSDYGNLNKGGFSLPVSKIMTKEELVNWGDGGIQLGQYIAMLATEFKLLSDNGQNTDDVKEELYYALKAFERLDANAESVYGAPSSLNGFFIRDDISEELLNSSYWDRHPFPFLDLFPPNITHWYHGCYGALESVTYRDGTNSYDENLTKSIGNNTVQINLPNTFCGGTKVYPHFTSDFIKKIKDINSKNFEPSTDQIAYLLLGFYFTQKYLNGIVANINGTTFNFKQQADTYTQRIFDYLEANNYLIFTPNGNLVDRPYAWAEYVPLIMAYEDITQNNVTLGSGPLKKIAGLYWLLGTLRPDILYHGIGNNDLAFLNGAIASSNAANGTNQPYIPSSAWITFNDHRRTYIEALAVIGNSWEYGIKSNICHTTVINLLFFTIRKNWHEVETTPIDVTSILNNSSGAGGIGSINNLLNGALGLTVGTFANNCTLPFPIPNISQNNTAKNLKTLADLGNNDSKLFSLMHSLNHGPDNQNPSDIGYIQNRINEAPCNGPHNFGGSGLPENVIHWASHSAWNKDNDINYQPSGSYEGGNYNAVDYMLLYNIYRLSHPNYSNISNIDYHSQIDYKMSYDFPFTPNGFSNSYGTILNPASIKGIKTLENDGFVNINSNASVKFRAKNAIIMKPGFAAKRGSIFSAKLVDRFCDQNTLIQNKVVDSSGNQDLDSTFIIVDSTNVEQIIDSILNEGFEELANTNDFQEYYDSLVSYRYIPKNNYLQQFECSQGKIIKKEESKYKIYPIPTSGLLNIDFNSLIDQKIRMKVNASSGSQILDKYFNVQEGSNTLHLNLNSLAEGQYYLIIQDKYETFSNKITIKK